MEPIHTDQSYTYIVVQSIKLQHRAARRNAQIIIMASANQAITEGPDMKSINDNNRTSSPKKKTENSKNVKNTVIKTDQDKSSSSEQLRVRDSLSGHINIVSCPLCLEDLTTSHEPTATRCGHIFCSECIKLVLSRTKMCPKCLLGTTFKSCRRIYL